jgi:hypothetical protein
MPGLDFTVQRSWSNKSAKAGHDPCVPAAMGQAYFNSVPVFNDTISIMGAPMKGVKIAAGQSKTIDVDLFSDAATSGPWTVKAIDLLSYSNGGSPYLNFSFDEDKGQNGQKLHLTIKVNKASQYNAELFFLVSSLNGRENIWVGLVGN